MKIIKYRSWRFKAFMDSITGKIIVGLLVALLLCAAVCVGWININQDKFTVVFHTGPTTDPVEMDKKYGAILAELEGELGRPVELKMAV